MTALNPFPPQHTPYREWFAQPHATCLFPLKGISFVTDNIAITNCDFAHTPDKLQAAGIRSILSLDIPSAWDLEIARCQGLDVVESLSENGVLRPSIWHAGVETVWQCLLDENNTNSGVDLRNAVSQLDTLSREHPPVLVHCLAGKCRAPAVVAILLAKQQGISFKVAIDQIAKVQPVGLTADFVYSLVRANGVQFE